MKIRAKLTELINLVSATFQATKEKDRTAFLDQLARSFQDVIVDLYETDELGELINFLFYFVLIGFVLAFIKFI